MEVNFTLAAQGEVVRYRMAGMTEEQQEQLLRRAFADAKRKGKRMNLFDVRRNAKQMSLPRAVTGAKS